MSAKLKIVSAMCLFGSIGLFVRNIALPSSYIALIRGALGALCLLGVTLWTRSGAQWQGVKKNLLLLVCSGAAVGANWICLFEAYKYTTVAAATLCYYLAPVFVLLVSPFLLKEKLTLTRLACIGVALAGMWLVAGTGQTTLAGDNPMTGALYGLMAAGLYASVVVMNKFLKDISSLNATMWQLGVAALVLLPYVLTADRAAVNAVTGKSLLLVAVVGLVHTGFGYYLYFSAIRELPGQTAAILSYIDPVVAILLSALLLGERLLPLQAVGAVLILGSTLFGSLKIPGKEGESTQGAAPE